MQQSPITFHDSPIILAEPRGFCAGVDRAIDIVEKCIEIYGAPIFVRHEIVHNKHVVNDLKSKGAVFIDEVDDAPGGSTLIFSAHGVSKEVQAMAQQRDLRVIDATCPLVTKVHLELLRHLEQGHQVILIGHQGHPEVEGTMGQAPEGVVLLVSDAKDVANLQVKDETKLAFVTQTTLSVDDTRAIIAALYQRFPHIHAPKKEDICYATSNRQEAVKALAEQSDIVLVIGSKNSSNSNRLREVAERCHTKAYLIDDEQDIDLAWLQGNPRIGITAGASAPEALVKQVIQFLQVQQQCRVQTLKVTDEHMIFSLPKSLRP